MASSGNISAAWYLNRADECEQQAKQARSADERRRYQEEAIRWREIAADIAKGSERSVSGES